MNIVMFAPNDPAGMSIAFTKAINRYTSHSCRTITTKEKYSCGFDKDLHAPDMMIFDEIQELLNEADIFHFHTTFTEDTSIGPYRAGDYIKGKKITHHFHGHPLVRKTPDKYRIRCMELKRKILVSTPDLRLFFPDSYWMPNIVDINDWLYMPSDEKHEEFTVSQAITNIALKDTELLIQAAIKAGVELDLIMNVSHSDCLRRKQKSQVCFDHLRGFYGLSSLESLSQGVPVIANLSEWVERNIKVFAETEDLPWIKCSDANEIYFVLFHFVTGGEDIRPYCEHSRKFMENHWNPKKVVERLIKFYEGL